MHKNKYFHIICGSNLYQSKQIIKSEFTNFYVGIKVRLSKKEMKEVEGSSLLVNTLSS